MSSGTALTILSLVALGGVFIAVLLRVKNEVMRPKMQVNLQEYTMGDGTPIAREMSNHQHVQVPAQGTEPSPRGVTYSI